MSKNVDKIAEVLGAKVVARLPRTGGGAFGAARLAAIVERLQARLAPSHGKRPGRPTDANWVHHPKIPMSKATEQRLIRLAQRISDQSRKVSAMQLAAQLLEDAVARIEE
jgi:ribosomal protein S12 methylthiotransferase accessory factor YcaO